MKTEIKVSDFLNNEYKNYSNYVIRSRAIPSVVDSFKLVNRKIIFVAEKHLRNTSNKVATLAGKIISEANYNHGNVSCEDAIVVMSQEFKNNMPLFERIGQFGSLKAPFPAASRYISVKLSKNFDLVYKDNELLEYRDEDGQNYDPKFFLPIIPMVLVNGGSGVAVGFATNVLNREPKQVVKDCISYLNGKKISKLTPYIDSFIGTFKNDSENSRKWYISGKFDIENTSTVRITEIPPSMTYEKFENLLDTLIDKREITNWENQCDDNINYVIKFTREKLASLNETDIYKMFKLVDQETENFTVLDENENVKIFDSAEIILKYFVDYREKIYQKRKAYQLKKIKDDIFKLEQRYKFVKAVVDAKIVINNKKKEEIIKSIEAQKIEKYEDSYDYLLNMPIYSLSKTKLDELSQSIKDKKSEEKVIFSSDPKNTYIYELELLLKQLK